MSRFRLAYLLAFLFWGLLSIHCSDGEPECIPDCAGKCCGGDGCGGACPGYCPAGEECNPQTCRCESGCRNDSGCTPTQCCIDNDCVEMSCGNRECGPDPVCQKECGPCDPGDICVFGVCQDGPLGGDCPAGQECTQMTTAGSMGCIIPPNNIPAENPEDCIAAPCRGNYSCYCRNQDCGATQCVENCGTCPAGSECCQVTAGGVRGCMLPGCTEFLPDPPDCRFTDCPGNAGCFTDGSRYWCIHLCSEDYGPCNDGDRKCEANRVRQCRGNAWVTVETCDPDTQICEGGVCLTLQSCNLENGAGDCPPGEMCYPWDQNCSVFKCYPAGTAAVGGACQHLTGCEPGAICMEDSLCYQVCSATIACTGTETCQDITGCPADFGVCTAD